MSVSGQRICRLAEEAADSLEPEGALDALTRLRAELVEFERQQVARALTAGRTYAAVAEAMGISRQAANRRFGDLAPGRRKTSAGIAPSPEVRLAFEYARAEAEALRARVLGPEHIVLGIVRGGDDQAARALARAGVELDAARAAVRAAAPAEPSTDSLRAVLADSVRVATRSAAQRIEVVHVLRAALARIDDVEARLGVPPDRVVAALDATPADCAEV